MQEKKMKGYNKEQTFAIRQSKRNQELCKKQSL